MNVHNETIIDILKNASPKTLQKKLRDFHPSDLAEGFMHVEKNIQQRLLKILDHRILADMLSYPDPMAVASLLKPLDSTKIARILTVMDVDDATDIMKCFSIETKNQIFKNMAPSTVQDLRQLIHYQEETAGSIMTTDYIVLRKGMDIKEAMKTLITNAKTTEGIQRLFVLDDNDFLEGVIELKKMIQARAPKNIEDLMVSDVITVKEDDHTEEVARIIQNYGIYLLPVVNDNNQLKGVITMDDAADILDQETDEDYARFASISSEEMIDRSIMKSALHRLPWLTVLLSLGLVVSAIIGGFENTIDQITALVFFQPLILGMAGNTGTQSLAVTVRGLSKNYYQDFESAKTHLIKELKVGATNGVGIGILSFITTWIFLTILHNINFIELHHAIWLIAMTVGLSAFVGLSLSSLIGAIVPLSLNKMKLDPAVASGPFITMLIDILALVIYFAFATIIILKVWGA